MAKIRKIIEKVRQEIEQPNPSLTATRKITWQFPKILNVEPHTILPYHFCLSTQEVKYAYPKSCQQVFIVLIFSSENNQNVQHLKLHKHSVVIHTMGYYYWYTKQENLSNVMLAKEMKYIRIYIVWFYLIEILQK